MTHDKLISVDVSSGELIDKITILEIKAERLSDGQKLRCVREELEMLKAAWSRAVEPSPQLAELIEQLKRVNAELWRIEDEIRLCEQRKDFGAGFIELARSVYRKNDRRSDLKRQVNELTGSRIVEAKSYAPY